MTRPQAKWLQSFIEGRFIGNIFREQCKNSIKILVLQDPLHDFYRHNSLNKTELG